jgi:hypothetical protein
MFGLADMQVLKYPLFERNFAKNPNMPNLAGMHVYICDISFPADVLSRISSIAASLHVWDHHISTARELLTQVGDSTHAYINITYHGKHSDCKVVAGCQFYLHIDTKLCGAEMAAANLRVCAPWYLKHIRDRDFYDWRHPQSRAFSEALFEANIRQSTFARLDNFSPADIEHFYARGAVLLEHNARIVATICRKAEVTTIGGVKTFIVWSATLQSDIGNHILESSPDAMVWIIRYAIKRKVYDVSMRSAGAVDVAEVAIKYNGGGHTRAAGFEYSGDIRELFETL